MKSNLLFTVLIFIIFVSSIVYCRTLSKGRNVQPFSSPTIKLNQLQAKSNKPTCTQPSSTELGMALSAKLSSSVTIMDYHFTCLAVRAFHRYQSSAVIISYYETMDNTTRNRTVQLEIECSNGGQWMAMNSVDYDGFSQLPPMQYQCYKCVSSKPSRGPGSTNGYNEDTWCLECSENCKQMGGGFCVSPSTYSCCPYFTKYDGVCTDECDSANDTNHCTDNQCEGNWTGTDCNECSLQCFNGGTPNSTTCASCICPEGYTGTYCDSPLPTLPPTTPAPTFAPSCDDDYCFNNGTPMTTNCSHCICPSGFTGERCEEETIPDPCTSNPCLNGGTCIPNGSEYSCICPLGWTGDHCEADRCSGYCENGGRCRILDNDEVYCDCEGTGYTGPTCTDPDRCLDNPCENGGTCHDTGSSIECECPDGYTGSRCEDRVCPCINGGSCRLIEGELICVCPTGYLGPLCQHKDPCIPNPCLNGGICSFPQGIYDAFSCTCPTSWTGTTCDICMNTGDSECQPTNDSSVDGSTKYNHTGLIVGIVIASIMILMLLGTITLLGILIYKRIQRLRDLERSTEVDRHAFDGSKVMVNPVFVRPDDLSIEESLNRSRLNNN